MKKIKTPLQIRFNDIDLAGHVHNSIYLHYFEIGRIDYFKKIISKDWNWKKQGILIGRNEIDYLKPVRFEDSLFIETFVEKTGNKSIVLGYEVFTENNNSKIICAKGKSTLVCFDFTTKKSVEIFEEWKRIIL